MADTTFYPIDFFFRGKEFKAMVQDYGTQYWRVNFGHESGEIVREFGYVIEFFAREIKSPKQGVDLSDLETAIRKELKANLDSFTS